MSQTKSMLISVLLASMAFVLAAARINHGLVNSVLPTGPGLTLDESFNIGQGVYLFESFLDHGPFLFTPATAQEVFGREGYLPDHPPLGRFVLGAAHQLTASAIAGAEHSVFNVAAARLGSCFAFALTVLLISEFARRQYGIGTAVLASVFLMLMPRAVGHARIASLESMTSLTWLTAVIPLLVWWTDSKPPTVRRCAVSGLFLGLLLLTKVQGILLPPLIVGWALYQYRHKAVVPLMIWGLTGCIVFFLGWPWLWLDPVANTLQYLGRAADRPTLFVWYIGERYADKAVPWHFPFVMLAATTPLCVTTAFFCRLWSRRFLNEELLLIGSVAWPLLVFALPGTPVYDGVRLFAIVLPLVALTAARGVLVAWNGRLFTNSTQLDQSSTKATGTSSLKRLTAATFCGAVLVVTITNVAVHRPFCLDDYPGLPGSTKTAVDTFGLEASYWADGLNADFWEFVPEGAVVYVAPVSHQFQLSDVEQLVPVVAHRKIELRAFEYDPSKQRGLILLIHRLADLPPLLRTAPQGATVIADIQYRGATLAQLIDTTDATWNELPSWPENK